MTRDLTISSAITATLLLSPVWIYAQRPQATGPVPTILLALGFVAAMMTSSIARERRPGGDKYRFFTWWNNFLVRWSLFVVASAIAPMMLVAEIIKLFSLSGYTISAHWIYAAVYGLVFFSAIMDSLLQAGPIKLRQGLHPGRATHLPQWLINAEEWSAHNTGHWYLPQAAMALVGTLLIVAMWSVLGLLNGRHAPPTGVIAVFLVPGWGRPFSPVERNYAAQKDRQLE
jgi:hypothetical protein